MMASASSIASAAAQEVTGRVVDSESLGAVAGAIVVGLDGADALIAQTLTNEDGIFLLPYTAGAPPVSLRVDRIGYAMQRFTRSDFSLEAFSVLRVSSAPVRLEAVTVLSESLCGSAALESQGVIPIWEEIRKGLEATALANAQRVQTFEIENVARSLEPGTEVVLRGSTERRLVEADRPFRSISVEKMTDDGWADVAGDGVTYYAPDERVLLSDEFADQHCFNVDESGEGILLRFEPNQERTGLPEITGAMVLDDETLELRYIRFTYDGLPGFPSGVQQAEGEVRFTTIPAGLRIVGDWVLRMPVMTVSPDRDRVRLDYVREVRGQIRDVHLLPDQAARVFSEPTSRYAWAPTNRLSSWTEDAADAGVLLYVRNGLSLPVRVSKIELWACTNVAVDCEAARDVDVRVEPGEMALVLGVPRQDPARPVELRWSYEASPGAAAPTSQGDR